MVSGMAGFPQTQWHLEPSSDGSALRILESIQDRVLWLSTQIVHYANSTRRNPDGVKVGGHQASSASVVSLMTALYFHELRRGDFVSVKPHASPVFHAIQYLLGNLAAEKLTELRAYKGLQAYPSRTKDVDPVDFSTGSVGLGAVVPNFAALTARYVEDHFGSVGSHRFFAIIGDAELDEGSVWEALSDENLHALDQIVWIVDLNRQSLDRVVPSGKAQKIEELFRVHDWDVIEVKYEDLVADIESSCRRVLEFIDAPWHPGILDHQRTARNRPYIRTASYNQVVRPLYSEASGRWLRYREHIEQVLPLLEPWVERLGYGPMPKAGSR